MKKGIIFDLDGTLWDSTEYVSNIWNCVFEKHGISLQMTKELSGKLMGKTMKEIGEILFPEMSVEMRERIRDDFVAEEVSFLSEHGALLYEGVEQSIPALSEEYNLYIVSNCQDGYVQAFLHAHDLETYFSDIEMNGRTGMNKGKNIKLIMERNQLNKAVYVGDTKGDEEASRYAEIPFIWAAYGFGEASAPDAVIKAIDELQDVVRDFL